MGYQSNLLVFWTFKVLLVGINQHLGETSGAESVTALRKETGREFRGILKLFLANCASQFFKLHFKVINN